MAAREKALFGVWADLKPADVNRILKPHGVRLVVKGSKAWGRSVNVTAQRLPLPDDVVVLVAPTGSTDGGQS